MRGSILQHDVCGAQNTIRQLNTDGGKAPTIGRPAHNYNEFPV